MPGTGTWTGTGVEDRGCLVSSRAETLNKAIASGSQKVNVDVVQQRDYSRRSCGGQLEVADGRSFQGHHHPPALRTCSSRVCVCISTHFVYFYVVYTGIPFKYFSLPSALTKRSGRRWGWVGGKWVECAAAADETKLTPGEYKLTGIHNNILNGEKAPEEIWNTRRSEAKHNKAMNWI